MKKLIVFLIAILSGLAVRAQAPQSFKYQAVARDATGNVLANKNVTFRISIVQGTVSGTIVYNELHSKTTNSYGLLDLEIGHGTSPSGDFSAIKWAVDQFFMKVEMDPAGGIAFQNMGTSQLLSVPYALYAKNTQNGDNWGSQTVVTDATLSGNGLTVTPLKLNQQGATSGQVLKWTGSTWQPGSDNSSLWSLNSTNVYYNGGKVGIGTSTPAGQLHIYANSSTSLAHLQLTESENDYARFMFTNTSFAQKSWTIGGMLGKLTTDSKIDFIYNDGLVAPKTVLSITGEGEVHHTSTGDTHMLPIAYGTVSSTGAILTGSGNFSVVYDATNKSYEINIDGETYSYSQYATLVTHVGSGDIGFPSVTSSSGGLYINFYMADGTKKASYFSFLVYKP